MEEDFGMKSEESLTITIEKLTKAVDLFSLAYLNSYENAEEYITYINKLLSHLYKIKATEFKHGLITQATSANDSTRYSNALITNTTVISDPIETGNNNEDLSTAETSIVKNINAAPVHILGKDSYQCQLRQYKQADQALRGQVAL